MIWKPSSFLIASNDGPRSVEGYVSRGLGLHIKTQGRPPTWTVTHLGSGHAVNFFRCNGRDMFPAATDLAGITDWTLFDLFDGWRQTDPDLPEKMRAFRARHPAIDRGIEGNVGSNEAARAVARERGE